MPTVKRPVCCTGDVTNIVAAVRAKWKDYSTQKAEGGLAFMPEREEAPRLRQTFRRGVGAVRAGNAFAV